jgi:hypothetical protein
MPRAACWKAQVKRLLSGSQGLGEYFVPAAKTDEYLDGPGEPGFGDEFKIPQEFRWQLRD